MQGVCTVTHNDNDVTRFPLSQAPYLQIPFLLFTAFIDNKNLFKLFVYTNIWIYTEPPICIRLLQTSQPSERNYTITKLSTNQSVNQSINQSSTYITQYSSAIIHRLWLLSYICRAVRTLSALQQQNYISLSQVLQQ